VVDDLLCHLSRVFAALLCQDERDIRLVIAKSRVGRRHDFPGGRESTGLERPEQFGGKQSLKRLHQRKKLTSIVVLSKRLQGRAGSTLLAAGAPAPPNRVTLEMAGLPAVVSSAWRHSRTGKDALSGP
jgi:hypothetical protein